MKKFKIFYTVAIILLLIVGIIRYLGPCLPICVYNEAFFGIVDGFKHYFNVSIINFPLVIVSMILNFVYTLNKENKLKNKWILFAIIIIELIFIPLGTKSTRGGIAGVNIDEGMVYLFNIMFLAL